MLAKLAAEFIGTFWLVLGGCGSAVLASAFPEFGIGFTGVSLAFGLTVLTGAYALGPISGGHFNPAVSVGLWAGGRFPAGQLLPYIIAQVAGAVVAAGALYLIASGKAGYELGGFAANGYGEHSPGKYGLMSALVCEIVMTFMFLIVILGATHTRAPVGFAGLAIGLALVSGICVRLASGFGLIYMLTLLFSSNYPGAGAPLWEYFGAALNHLVLALCFMIFLFSHSDAVLSTRRWIRRSERVRFTSGS